MRQFLSNFSKKYLPLLGKQKDKPSISDISCTLQTPEHSAIDFFMEVRKKTVAKYCLRAPRSTRPAEKPSTSKGFRGPRRAFPSFRKAGTLEYAGHSLVPLCPIIKIVEMSKLTHREIDDNVY